MAHRTDDHSDMTLFKNRLWKLMDEKHIYTTKELAKILYSQQLVAVKQKKCYDEPSKIYGNAIGAIDKKIQKHLNANTARELQGEFVIAYCTFFGCSADYLLGLIEMPTHTETDIHAETGLSAEAIELLIDWNEKAKLPHDDFYRISILFFNDLLECCGIQAVALAQNVSNYLFYRKISETENLTSKITKDKYDKYEIARVRASYKFMDCLEYIYAHSKNIPTKEELQKKYPRTEEEKLLDEILG